MHNVCIHELCVITVSIDRKVGEVNFTGEEFLSALFTDSPKCQEQCSETEHSNCSEDNMFMFLHWVLFLLMWSIHFANVDT